MCESVSFNAFSQNEMATGQNGDWLFFLRSFLDRPLLTHLPSVACCKHGPPHPQLHPATGFACKSILQFVTWNPPHPEIAGVPYDPGLMKTHWFPLIRPAKKSLISEGGTIRGGWLTSHEWCMGDHPCLRVVMGFLPYCWYPYLTM